MIWRSRRLSSVEFDIIRIRYCVKYLTQRANNARRIRYVFNAWFNRARGPYSAPFRVCQSTTSLLLSHLQTGAAATAGSRSSARAETSDAANIALAEKMIFIILSGWPKCSELLRIAQNRLELVRRGGCGF